MVLRTTMPEHMRVTAILLAALAAAVDVRAQAPAPSGPLKLPATICGLQVPAPAKQPPTGSPPLVNNILLCFPTQGNVPMVEAQTYQYYIEMKNHVSMPSTDKWVPYTEQIEQIILGDFKRLWATNFLDDLSI